MERKLVLPLGLPWARRCRGGLMVAAYDPLAAVVRRVDISVIRDTANVDHKQDRAATV